MIPWELAPESSKPRLLFSQQAWQKMMQYVSLCPVEINGYGLIDRVDDNTLYVSDIFILDQIVSAISADSSAQALGNYAVDMLNAGGDPSRIRLQWHSHVNMPAYFSGTDVANIEQYGNGSAWMVSLVVNKRGDFQARLDIYQPFRVYCDLEYEVELTVDDSLTRQCRDDIQAKVREQGVLRSRAVETPRAAPRFGSISAEALRGTHDEG